MKTETLLKVDLSTSTGLDEAGDWLKRHTKPETLIISQNLRPTRYFTKINYLCFGGQLALLPPTKKEFEEILSKHPGHILVMVDVWSESNPSEFSPFWREKEDEAYFRRLKFRLEKTVYRDIYSYNGSYHKSMRPVVKIFERGI